MWTVFAAVAVLAALGLFCINADSKLNEPQRRGERGVNANDLEDQYRV